MSKLGLVNDFESASNWEHAHQLAVEYCCKQPMVQYSDNPVIRETDFSDDGEPFPVQCASSSELSLGPMQTFELPFSRTARPFKVNSVLTNQTCAPYVQA